MESGRSNLEDAVSATTFPTPTAQDSKSNGNASQMRRNTLPLNAAVAVGGRVLNPDWVELLMGWPKSWTLVLRGPKGGKTEHRGQSARKKSQTDHPDSRQSETGKSRSARHSRGAG
jgi:hypothetical protein